MTPGKGVLEEGAGRRAYAARVKTKAASTAHRREFRFVCEEGQA